MLIFIPEQKNIKGKRVVNIRKLSKIKFFFFKDYKKIPPKTKFNLAGLLFHNSDFKTKKVYKSKNSDDYYFMIKLMTVLFI